LLMCILAVIHLRFSCSGFSILTTRYSRVGLRNRVSYPNLGEDAQIIAETRFLSRKIYQRNRVSKFPSHSTATNVELHKKDRQQLSTVFDECVFDSVADDV